VTGTREIDSDTDRAEPGSWATRLSGIDPSDLDEATRLVAIHPFPSGNGRHARMMADLLSERLGGQSFKWGGGGSLHDVGDLRAKYIAALRAADGHDIGPLIEFARS
jgi:fido (protein-threonine AMPylation protein)